MITYRKYVILYFLLFQLVKYSLIFIVLTHIKLNHATLLTHTYTHQHLNILTNFLVDQLSTTYYSRKPANIWIRIKKAKYYTQPINLKTLNHYLKIFTVPMLNYEINNG